MGMYEEKAEILPLPCPGLMEFVERGDLESQELRRYLTELFWTVSEKPVEVIVLGCTHYPFARDMIQEVVGDQVKIYDGGNGTAREMRRRLEEAGLRNPSSEGGAVTFLNSRNTTEEQELCNFLLHR